jgi:16S rRNA (guanine(966)-N(2))-methyltransferase RsmD
MRIISGKYKSRRVYSLPADVNCVKGKLSSYRPTTDRARETLFNVLNNIIDFDGVRCLDLFAGSGALGFEAISRGAESCDFVEHSPKQITQIEKTSIELECVEQCEIYNDDVPGFLEANEGSAYDLIFADPPYSYENYNRLITLVMKLKFSVFVLEYGLHSSFLYDLKGYDLTDKKIGAVNFKIFVSKSD